MAIDLSSYKSLYIQTAREQLGIIKNNFMLIRLNPEDMAAVKKAYIAAHSLKGQSSVMNYLQMAQVCKMVEYIFRNMLAGEMKLDQEVINTIQEALVQIDTSIGSIEKYNQETDFSEIILKLQKYENIAR